MISRGVLEELNGMSLSRAHREHVTLAIVEGVVNVDMHGCRAPASLAYPKMRFDVDRPEDLLRISHFICQTHDQLFVSASDIVESARKSVG